VSDAAVQPCHFRFHLAGGRIERDARTDLRGARQPLNLDQRAAHGHDPAIAEVRREQAKTCGSGG